MSIVPPNELRRVLQNGGLAVGTMVVEIRQSAIAQCLANAGFDWAIIDNEHGCFNSETLADLSRACRAAGVTPIVRVPVVTYDRIAQTLDGGAQGIMLPRITRREEVELAVAAMKFPPDGRRGNALGRAHTSFQSGDVASAMADSNRETFLIVQVETREALERLDDLLAVPGVDAALVGPNDLAIALGIPGRMRDPQLFEAIERTMAACARHGVYPAIHTNDVALTAEWAGRGMRLVSISSEIGHLLAAARSAVTAVRAPIEAARATTV